MEICVEDYISRIPGLFAYIGTEGTDSGVLHHSYDNIDGCYGKVPASVMIPYGCQMFFYDKTDFDENAVYVDVLSVPEVTGNEGYEHLRRFEYYKTSGDEVYSYYRKKNMLSAGRPVEYSTLMYLYYKYRDSKTVPVAFVNFVEYAIGKVKVERPSQISDMSIYDLVPDYIYLSQVRKLYTEYLTLSKSCSGGCEGLSKKSHDVCCACERYKRMGGDFFLMYLKSLLETSDERSEEMYNNSLSIGSGGYIPAIGVSLSISASVRDLGYSSSYVNELSLGIPVYDGDLVTYNGETYICCLTGTHVLRYYNDSGYYGQWLREQYGNVEIKGRFFRYDGSGFVELQNPVPGVNYMDSTSGYFNAETMMMEFDKAHFVLLRDYVTHVDMVNGYTPEQLSSDGFYFDGNKDGHSYLYGDFIANNSGELPQCEWTYSCFGEGDNPPVSIEQEMSAVSFDIDPLQVQSVTGDMVEFPEYVKYFDTVDNVMKYYWKSRTVLNSLADFDRYKISGYSDSKLKSLRRFVNYLNEAGFSEVPDFQSDWLYFYKSGYVTNIQVERDGVGNILRTTNDPRPQPTTPAPIDRYLVAYGDVITSITYNQDERTITFEYVLGAHLVAGLSNTTQNEDGDTIYIYTDFAYDEESDEGVKYMETYMYGEDGEIANLISNGDFENFTRLSTFSNSYQDQSDPSVTHDYYYQKMSFGMSSNLGTTDVSIVGGDVTYSYISSGFETYVPNGVDMLDAPVFKRDEFVGVSYEPLVDGDIRIDRGNGASVERHLKLGDVYTVVAMEEYANGGFFNIRKDE